MLVIRRKWATVPQSGLISYLAREELVGGNAFLAGRRHHAVRIDAFTALSGAHVTILGVIRYSTKGNQRYGVDPLCRCPNFFRDVER